MEFDTCYMQRAETNNSAPLQADGICTPSRYIFYIYIEAAMRVSLFHPQTKTNSEDELRRRIPRKRIAPRRRNSEDEFPEDELRPEDEFPSEEDLRRRVSQ